jgi:hypothetical protein
MHRLIFLGEEAMPWRSSSAKSFTSKAKSKTAKRQWMHVANNMLKSGASKGAAIRAANGVLKRRSRKR